MIYQKIEKNLKFIFVFVFLVVFACMGREGNAFAKSSEPTVMIPQSVSLDESSLWYVSTNGNDDNDCSVPGMPCATVDAVFAKPDFQDGDEIHIASGTYTGSETTTNVLNIENDVTLVGGWNEAFDAQVGDTIFDGENERAGIRIYYGYEVTIDNFIIENANSSGVSGRGLVTLKNCEIRNNSALDGSGGGVVADLSSEFTIINCDIHSNQALVYGGGIGVYDGSFTMINSQVYDNQILSTNSGSAKGGGIYIGTHDPVMISGSEIYGNSTMFRGGGISIEGSTASTVTIMDTLIYDNHGVGGGIFGLSTTLEITNSSIFHNSSPDDGGGIYLNTGTLRFNNSTLSENSAAYHGAGFYTDSISLVIEINNSTIANNFGEGFNFNAQYDTQFIVKNSIIAANHHTDIIAKENSVGCNADLMSEGYNLLGEIEGCPITPGVGDQFGIDPLLLPLADYGGNTYTHSLLPNSLAVDGGDPAVPGTEGACPVVDQRNISRPIDGNHDGIAVCDIGAFELTGDVSEPYYVFMYSGGGQQAWVTDPFAEFFQAVVTDQSGNSVSGVSVVFTAPDSGPSGTFAGTGTNEISVMTDENGIAEAPEFTANNKVGVFEVYASVGEIISEYPIPLENKNHAPSLSIEAPERYSEFIIGEDIQFVATASDDEDGDIGSSVVWESNIDGVIGAGVPFVISNLSLGMHYITASVTDSHGEIETARTVITVLSNPPEVEITAPTDGTFYYAGNDVQFEGNAQDIEDGDLSTSIVWVSSLDGEIGTGASFSTTDLSTGMHTITASVTDSGGSSGLAQIEIEILADTTPPTAVFLSPLVDSTIQWPRAYLIVEADDAVSGVVSVTFEAYYDGAWHELFVDTNEENGWRFLWSTMALDGEVVSVRATVEDGAGNSVEIEIQDLPVQAGSLFGNGYQARGGREAEETPAEICVLEFGWEVSIAAPFEVEILTELPVLNVRVPAPQ